MNINFLVVIWIKCSVVAVTFPATRLPKESVETLSVSIFLFHLLNRRNAYAVTISFFLCSLQIFKVLIVSFAGREYNCRRINDVIRQFKLNYDRNYMVHTHMGLM